MERLIEVIREHRAADVEIRNGCPFDSANWNWFEARIQALDYVLIAAARVKRSEVST